MLARLGGLALFHSIKKEVNNACRGYVIYAMENCGFSPQDIRRVVAELYEVFDIRGLEEAQQHYERSPY